MNQRKCQDNKPRCINSLAPYNYTPRHNKVVGGILVSLRAFVCSDSITWDMLLENDGNFGEVINGTDIRPDSTLLSLYDILVQAPSRAGFCTGNCKQNGRAPALTLAGYAPCDRAPPEMHPLRMFEILGHPHFKQLHGHKMPMNATNLPDRLNLYIFSLNLSYHSFVSVQDIQQKRLLNKISVYVFTHPGGHHRAANAMLFVACTHDGCATFRSPVTSSEVSWFTWSPL